jgi:hypothetical protein
LSWYGTAVSTAYKQGKLDTINYTVTVEDKKIHLTTTDARTGKEVRTIQTIVTLTENELALRDEDQNVYRMIRVRQ